MHRHAIYTTVNGANQYEGDFKPSKLNIKPLNESLVFAFSNSDISLFNETIPTLAQLHLCDIDLNNLTCIGQINNIPCFIANIKFNTEPKLPYKIINLRQAYTHLSEDCLRAAIYGYHITVWDTKTRFCGACGTKTEESSSTDWVKKCPKCSESYFPKISPAIIVAINHKGKLLMALHNRMPNGRYTILAGFVNPGESLEECLHREVFEEAGIKVANIEYFGSQPWPFPDSLMIGFKADYVSGDLTPDNDEIIDLKWFAPNEIPEWPNRSSISRSLIDDFIKTHK